MRLKIYIYLRERVISSLLVLLPEMAKKPEAETGQSQDPESQSRSPSGVAGTQIFETLLVASEHVQ